MTLVEVSIAAVVLAMLLTGLVTAMRSFALTYGSLEGLTQSTERLRETTSFFVTVCERPFLWAPMLSN